MPDPDAEQTYDVSPTDRQVIRAALDFTRGILLVGGLDEERTEAKRVQETLNETPEDSPVTLREVDAARALSALYAYSQKCLDEGDVPEGADAQDAIYTFTSENAALAQMMEDTP